ncbi:NudC domain-containing protein 1 [Quaeritorhiza haematococci]|nr:NudC domain-containing protein 1 [Quaeritorhiza haematococci]
MATHGDSDAGSSGTMTQDDLFSLFRSRTTGLSPCVLAASRFIPGTDELSVLVYQTVEELVDERPSSISFSSSSSSSTRPQPHSKKVRKAVFYLSLLQVQGISRLSSQPTSPLPSSPQSFASSSAVNLDTKVLTTVKGLSGPYYVAIEPNGEGFVVASEIPYEVARSRTPSPSASPARTSQQEATDTSSSTTSALTTKQGSNTSDIEYTWTQSEEDVTIHVRLPKMVLKSEVKCDFQPSSIKLRIVQAATKQSLDVFASAAGGQEVAQLYHPIIPSECLWTIEKNRLLTLHLTKSTRRHRWPHVFAQDDGVLESLDPNEIAEFRDKLERFTSSSSDELMEIDSGSRSRLGLGAGGSSSSSSNNIADENPFSIHQQSITSRTEAEDFEGQSVTVRRFSHTGDLTHEARGGGHEWMCCAFEGSAPSSQSDSSARTGMRPVCLKLDIDGLIYALGTPSIASDSFALNHVGTFPALGFVRASKKDRRFTFVTTKETGDVGGWAVIVENKRHVYLYGNGGESQQQQSSSRHLYADQYIVDLDEDGDVEMVDSTTRGSGDSNVIGVQQIRGGIVVLRTGDLVVIAMGEV